MVDNSRKSNFNIGENKSFIKETSSNVAYCNGQIVSSKDFHKQMDFKQANFKLGHVPAIYVTTQKDSYNDH